MENTNKRRNIRKDIREYDEEQYAAYLHNENSVDIGEN